MFDCEEYFNSLPDNIIEIDVTGKKLSYLPDILRFTNLKSLNCSTNKLTSLPPLNENLQFIYCNNNPIFDIINNYNLDIIKKYINTLNNFKHLYYSLKFKKQFYNWYWPIKEKLVKIKYAPDNLFKLLQTINITNNDEIDKLIKNW